MTNERMFPFITNTWNPLKGVCPHNCYRHSDGKPGCWAQKIIEEKPVLKAKYQGPYDFDMNQIERKFKSGSFVFVCDMLDLFAANVPMVAVQIIMKLMAAQPEVTFLTLTKNPRYAWIVEIPKNVIVGATIESNINYNVSQAPKQTDRLEAMRDITDRKMLSIEPIMDFDLEPFVNEIIKVGPEFVAVGYDNYKNGLIEPSFSKTLHLIAMLEGAGIKVYRKTIRDPVILNCENKDRKQG
jgi:protein gp37